MSWRRISSPILSGRSPGSCSISTLKKRFVRFIRSAFAPNFYTKGMACAICETRRPRRFCPGVRGNICSVCCGTEREMTVDCPLDCEFLREARRHEKLEPINPDALPNAEIQLSHKFLEENEHLLIFLGRTIAMAA